MNAVVALCHFCEMHGPSVIMSTQPFHRQSVTEIVEQRNSGEDDDDQTSFKRLSISGSETDLAESDTFEIQDPFTSSTCSACRSFPKPNVGFLTYGDDGDLWYLTLQYPHNPDVFTFLRQACVRSLSSEISPGREGPIIFGDDHHGYVYSYTFYLKDNEARGMQRWYSIVVLSMDKMSLTQSWPFLTRSSRSLVAQLQKQAENVYDSDQAEKPQRAVRLAGAGSINPGNFRQQRRGKAMRSLPELTSDSNIFHFVHEHFTHLLQLGGNQMSETLLEGSPSSCYPRSAEDQLDSISCSDSEKFHIGISNTCQENGISHLDQESSSEAEINWPRFEGILHIYRVMGKQSFLRLAHHIVIGNQIVVRGFYEPVVSSVIHALEILIPPGCRRSIYFSNSYESPWNCNFLGLHFEANMPDDLMSSPDYFVVDVMAAKMSETNIEKYKIITLSQSFPPAKVPSYISRLEQILKEQEMVEELAAALVINLYERLLSKAKVLFKLFRTESRSAQELPIVMEKLHIPEEDQPVMTFWMSALSQEYRNYLKEISVSLPLPFSNVNGKLPLERFRDDKSRRTSSSSKDSFSLSDVQFESKRSVVV